MGVPKLWFILRTGWAVYRVSFTVRLRGFLVIEEKLKGPVK